MPKTQKGFTLLEVIVVLMIVSMVGVLMIQGLTHFMKVKERIAETLSNSQIINLHHSWFRDIVFGLSVFDGTASYRFKGDARSMFGMTMNSLDYQRDVPTRFFIKVEDEGGVSRVYYHPAEQLKKANERTSFELKDHVSPWLLLEFKGSVELNYVTQDSVIHSQWPPKGKLNKFLPEAVLLVNKGEGKSEIVMWLTVNGRKKYPEDIMSLIYE